METRNHHLLLTVFTIFIVVVFAGCAGSGMHAKSKPSCKPTNSADHTISTGSATGEGCTKPDAKADAEFNYGQNECEGSTSDPGCPSNGSCHGKAKCKTTSSAQRALVTYKPIDLEKCKPSGKGWEATLSPTSTRRALCKCACK